MSTSKPKWITPFVKQSFVCCGVSLNMAAHGFIIGFIAVLLPQLRMEESSIHIDDHSGSWIAACIGITLVIGNLVAPSMMGRFGRKPTFMLSIAPLTLGWACIFFANSVTMLLIARLLHGFSMGMSGTLGPVLIGEYTSPTNRGAFLITISLFISAGVLMIHTLGSYLTWQTTAAVCGIISLIDLTMVFCSPETPSFLADQGRYEDCERIFRWLRGENEDDELVKMIEDRKMAKASKEAVQQSVVENIRRELAYFKSALRKKEFYKPVLIMMHMYAVGQWAGATVLVAYIIDVFENVVGTENTAVLVITLDIQRTISSAAAMFFVKKIKRRVVFFSTMSIGIFSFLAIALYVYCRNIGLISNYPLLGIALIHLLMFSVATGSIPLSFVFAGELYSLEYKSLSCLVSFIFYAVNMFLCVKTFPFMLKSLGFAGACCVYASLVVYCVSVVAYYLPETKDRTLQEIEDEFRGKPLTEIKLTCVKSLSEKKEKF